MAKVWRVIYVKSRCEKKALLSLSKLGCEAYVPLQKELRDWNDRKKWVEMVVFPNYVFVKNEFIARNIVFNCIHVLKYVFIGHKEVLLTEAEIETIQLLSKSAEKLEVCDKGFEIGENVVLKSGILKGLVGEIIKQEGEFYVRVKISGLSCYIRAKINRADLEELK